ncbi:cytochrome c oxidase assembly protein [Nocardioides terrigena]|uniref:cytochrome c oxidase assembly protein n=1 Tax=Nocardioides terrigena TaxID=424797 RepID=UPI00131EFCF7|nr:cytochrome c oxidase assembly protein [Nocardioides terrigena]
MTSSAGIVRGLALLAIGPAVTLVLLSATGAMTAEPVPGLPDPGGLTRYGLPLIQAVRNIAAGLTVGALVLASVCVPPQSDDRNRVTGARRALLDLVVVAASTWMWTSLALVGLTQSDALGMPVTTAGFAQQAVLFGQSYDLGRYLVVTAVLAALVATGALAARTITSVGLLAATSMAALWPMALAGHAAGSLNHDDAVNLQAVHLVGVSVWAGGLAALVFVRTRLGVEELTSTSKRFSALAGWCLALVTVSGVLGVLLRLPNLSSLASAYGALLAIKVVAIAVLAGVGWWQRRVGLVGLASGIRGSFVRIVLLEVAVLAVAAGAGVALSRTVPPTTGPEPRLTTAQAFLGHEMPPELGAAEWFTQWRPDTFWLPVAAAMLIWYSAAVIRLRSRGDRWPVGRTVAWAFGWLLLVWATSGAPGAYGRVLFSMHMVQHMTIALAVPTFLVLAAPVSLALRTLSRRADGSMGPREWLLRLVHSAPARLAGSPIVAAALVVVSLVAFYYSSLFELSLRTHTAHLVMTAHFLLSGYLFANCLVGIDPGPRRPAYPLRVLLILVTFGFHALFSVSLMASDQVLARGWFEPLGRTWGASLADDQYLGASLGWALGDYPLAILAVALVASWVHADQRERRRYDRQAARDGDRELTSYNDYLARLAAASDSGSPRVPARSSAAGNESPASDTDPA